MADVQLLNRQFVAAIKSLSRKETSVAMVRRERKTWSWIRSFTSP
ncbi:hypothetical protein PanWU01x14_010650 [Parasponia andersonii]|uniref:Uncharacterized protein n=1 Tax=Parasponia andersonii TaxID=3476 RepID=A0A2P5E2S6_PARAD|nr:hypothetical protein PanWU01x14_010650 [Parasponia andersonii]